MNLTIIGTGYVGLTTGTCFAEVGHHVTCVDNNPEKIETLLAGRIPIYEPGLEDLVKKNVAAGRLKFTTSTEEGVRSGDVVFIAVPTPPQPDGSVDLSFIEKVAREIAECLTPELGYRVIVDKSTVPVKTGEKVQQTVRRYAPKGVEFGVVSNPEFLREGCAVDDLLNPDRIVIGSNDDRALAVMHRVYEPFVAPVLVTDINSAELIKHAANSFLALKISYINAAQLDRFLGKIREKLWVLREKKIALWGLAFKQNTDDVRESVAVKLAKRMIDEGASIVAWDPEAIETAKRFANLGDAATFGPDMLSCLDGADALVIATEWPQFANVDLSEIKKRLRTPLVFDGRNLLDPGSAAAAGIEYHSIGRPSVLAE